MNQPNHTKQHPKTHAPLVCVSLASILALTLTLTGCATTTGTNPNTHTGNAMGTATDIGMNVLKSAIDNKCRNELKQHNAWRIARVAMTAEQEETVQKKICGCVSEQAPQQLTIADIANATIDQEYRTKLVTKVVAKSLQSCYANLMK